MIRMAPILLACTAAALAWSSVSAPQHLARFSDGAQRGEQESDSQKKSDEQKKSDDRKSQKPIPQSGRKPAQKSESQGEDEKVKPSGPKRLADFMRQKLDASNKVMEGLVTDDLKMISEASEQLMRISTAERWRIINDPTYGRFSREYRGTISKLKQKAQKGSLDGAALAWVDVTMSCIECHEWVRNVVIADGSGLRLGPAAPIR